MPSGWLSTGDSDYQSYTPGKGDILEIKVVDPAGAEQGTLLVGVIGRLECPGPGEAFKGWCLGASDDYYRYWITEGEGREQREDGTYHLCFKSIEECRTWRGKKEVVHTDRFRLVTPSNVKEGRVGWAKGREVKADLIGQLAKFEAMHPQARPRRRGDGHPPWEAERPGVRLVSLSESGSEEPSTSSDESEEVELLKKMTKLQEELKEAEKRVSDKKEAKEHKRVMKARKGRRDRGADKRKKVRRDSPPPEGEKRKKPEKEDKKDREKARNKRKKDDEEDAVSSEVKRLRRKKKKKKKAEDKKRNLSSPSGEAEASGEVLFKSGPPKKDAKSRGGKDRGPFGGGPAVRFKETAESASDSEEDSVFREAPASSTTLSGQQKLTRYSQRYPGRLASRLLLKMKEGAARELVGASNEEGPTPPLASHFILTVLLPLLGAKASMRTQRELKTLGRSLDLLARGEASQCADLLGQRIKALERASVEGHWMSAQFLELLPPDSSTLLERDEEVYLAKEFLLEQKVRRYDKPKFPPLPPGQKGKDQKGEKGKGKGKYEKGNPPAGKGGKEAEK